MVAAMSGHQSRTSKTDVWLTPLEIVRALGKFDLDPCGYPGHRTASRLICLPKNGLVESWGCDNRVFLNPPYAHVGMWLDRLYDHTRKRRASGVALVFARVETSWAQDHMRNADSIFFPRGRFTFLRADGSKPPYTSGAPSMFLSYGERPMWPFDGFLAK